MTSMGRLGAWTARNARKVFVAWAILAVALGVFAPRVEHALSGAGWEASGSESLRAREIADRDFGGLSSSALMVVVHSPSQTIDSAPFRAAVADGRLRSGSPEIASAFGKMSLAACIQGLAAPGFDEVLSVVRQG